MLKQKIIKDYNIIKYIGCGSFGTVYLVEIINLLTKMKNMQLKNLMILLLIE